jgi:hypothetical protein
MRPVNEKRIVVEYLRIERLVSPQLALQAVEDFGTDLHSRLASASDMVGRWWRHEWFLGNLEPRSWNVRADSTVDVPPLSFQFGWETENPSDDVPPPYDRATHQWSAGRAVVRGGALALVVVDVRHQAGAVTSLAGDVNTPGLCHALTDVLMQSEMDAMRTTGGVRTAREWLVERIDNRGAFEQWATNSVEKVTRVTASFHVPNPRTSLDIEPAVKYLNGLKAERGTLTASNPDGIDPFGDPVMQAALNMQAHDYGSITAKGVTASGSEDKFSSKKNPISDTLVSDIDGSAASNEAALRLRLLEAIRARFRRDE